MNEKPILMSPLMVEAILNGSKTMTRRLPKTTAITKDYGKHPIVRQQELFDNKTHLSFFHNDTEIKNEWGDIGDRLWVKEEHYAYGYWTDTERKDRPAKEFLTVNDNINTVKYGDDIPDEIMSGREKKLGYYKRNSLFMFKRHSRITLEIVNVKFEKLGDISTGDAIKEGIGTGYDTRAYYYGSDSNVQYRNPIDAFIDLWESIHGPGSWKIAREFYVWGIEFKVVKP